MKRVKGLAELYEFIGLVVLCAPDRFPKEDFLDEADHLTLDKAFAELYGAMVFIRRNIKDEQLLTQLQETLDSSLAAYRSGQNVKGAHLLQDFEGLAFSPQKASVTKIR